MQMRRETCLSVVRDVLHDPLAELMAWDQSAMGGGVTGEVGATGGGAAADRYRPESRPRGPMDGHPQGPPAPAGHQYARDRGPCHGPNRLDVLASRGGRVWVEA